MDGSSRVLPGLPEDLGGKAEASLIRLGARVRTGVRVTAIDSDGVTFEAGEKSERIEAKTVVWAGGVAASQLGRVVATRTKAQTDRGGRIRVNADLTIPGYPSIYVVGDLALLLRPDGSARPGVAQIAMQEGA